MANKKEVKRIKTKMSNNNRRRRSGISQNAAPEDRPVKPDNSRVSSVSILSEHKADLNVPKSQQQMMINTHAHAEQENIPNT